MDYRYLREWVDHNQKTNNRLIISDVKRYQENIFIGFKGELEQLQIVLDSSNPFLFFTTIKMLPSKKDSKVDVLNQHLNHSLICSIGIIESERIIYFETQKTDIYNQIQIYRLYCEFIPHKTNMILTKKSAEKEVVIDCWKYFTLADKTSRQILPGSVYLLPTRQVIESKQQNTKYLSAVKYPLQIESLISKKEDFADNIISRKFDDINSLFETFFYEYILPPKQNRIISDRIKLLNKEKTKKEKKLVKLIGEYEESKEFENYKRMAELLKVSLHHVRKGMESVKVIDYYSEDKSKIIIPLQQELTPIDNMKLLFKKYRKGIKGKEAIKQQINKTEEVIEKIDKEIFDIENRTIDIKDYKEQTLNQKTSTMKSKKIRKSDKYRKLKINKDWEVFIGRTNKENDELTCRMARPDDWWFHSRIFHGAHIILRNYSKLDITPELINLCSRLAAYYSKAKNSENVPVDYTQIRYVTKPHGSPAGYVIYKNQKTIYVNPLSLREGVKLVGTWQ
ncbi:MAG: DUF814 domain-containing protein [Candidatus Cloacimonetes bacterium]|nr:DUF814 domain-containing protein [Candidatus Cloacimonadota bacterium]